MLQVNNSMVLPSFCLFIPKLIQVSFPKDTDSANLAESHIQETQRWDNKLIVKDLHD